MPKLILIKHASPMIDPAKPSHQWQLSEVGRERSRALAARLREHDPEIIVVSEEPKAQETARIVGEELEIRCETAPGLHEHDRSNVPHMRSAEFISMIELFFRRPNELVLGGETAEEAGARLKSAIDDVLEQQARRNVAVVSHGTVIALYLSKLTDRPAFDLWRELQLPSFAVVALPEMRIEQIVPRIV